VRYDNFMKKWTVVSLLAISQFVMVLDSTVMNVSISTVVKDLNTTVSAMQAAITFYTLTMAAFMLIGAKIASKLGLVRAFVIGSIIYGIGSFITGISQNIYMLGFGWSFIEGLGAVLVIPSIAALVASNYSGKDRVTAYAIIGGISGAAAAAGPLIGGFMTTYLSWRWVFLIETAIMLSLLLFVKKFKETDVKDKNKIDFLSALYSATGMALVVFGMLQSKTWGWVTPITEPTINGQSIAPFGISIVAYIIGAGAFLLWLFYERQKMLETKKLNPLVNVSMFKAPQLRSGLMVLFSQYVIIAAIFFVIPIYLQMVLGKDSLSTGIKILPLSIALIIFSMIGSKLVSRYSPKKIIRYGQVLLVIACLALMASINRDLTGVPFAVAMFLTGAGLGLMASQIGNVNMSAVSPDKTSQVGGLQGSFQNLGSSFGTALIGSILIATMTTGFVTNVQNSTLPSNIKDYVSSNTKTLEIVPSSQVEQYAIDIGLTQTEAEGIATSYKDAQLEGLKESLFYLTVIAVFSLFLSRHIPNKTI
jgi:EmrB/QacA subfamily drug resistance transporter